jgi:hypothetical protein
VHCSIVVNNDSDEKIQHKEPANNEENDVKDHSVVVQIHHRLSEMSGNQSIDDETYLKVDAFAVNRILNDINPAVAAHNLQWSFNYHGQRDTNLEERNQPKPGVVKVGWWRPPHVACRVKTDLFVGDIIGRVRNHLRIDTATKLSTKQLNTKDTASIKKE